MNRLREAREYVGLSLMDMAGLLYVDIDDLANAEAGGSEDFTSSDWDLLSRVYRRPIDWLKGKPAEPVNISPELDRLMEKLSDHDKAEIVRFAEFLGNKS